jgi:uncharacterized membrane protein
VFVKDRKLVYALLSICSTTLGGVGQFLFKLSFSDGSIILTLGLGIGSYLVSTAIYFYVLSRVHLSWAYGLSGLSYILAVFLSASVLGEAVSMLRWAGVLVIALGVVLVGLS